MMRSTLCMPPAQQRRSQCQRHNRRRSGRTYSLRSLGSLCIHRNLCSRRIRAQAARR
jgi:hypothetical protein